MNPFRIFVVVVALTGSVYGQAFEVASIREVAGGEGIRSTIEPNPGSLTMRNTTLREAIRWAYDEPEARVGILDGPTWADSVRYDIAAKPAGASSTNDLRLMQQNLAGPPVRSTTRRPTILLK